MRRLAVVVVLVLVAAVVYRSFGGEETGTGTLTLPQPAPIVGQQAPRFTAESLDGKRFELTDRGVYVLTFWSTLNEFSNEARPGFARLARKYEDDEAFFAAVYVNSAPEQAEPYTVLQDRSGRLTSIYNVKRVPRLFVIRNGTIELVQNGYYPENEEQLEQKLDEILKSRSESAVSPRKAEGK